MYGPAGIPAPVLERLSADIRAVVDSRRIRREEHRASGIDAKGMRAGELGAWTRTEIAQWAEVAKAASIKVD